MAKRPKRNLRSPKELRALGERRARKRMKQLDMFPEHASHRIALPHGDPLPYKVNDKGLTRTLLVRFTPAEYAHVRRLAGERGQSASSLIRSAAFSLVRDSLMKMSVQKRNAWKAEAERAIVGGEA